MAPRKPDWDLKRDVAKKLEKLERRTQRAIAELISKFSHVTSLISALEQRVEKSLSFDTCKITCDDRLLDKAYLFLELAVTAERTRFISLK